LIFASPEVCKITVEKAGLAPAFLFVRRITACHAPLHGHHAARLAAWRFGREFRLAHWALSR
jgi:hypothetical protein